MIRCESRIVREFKTKLAESVPPVIPFYERQGKREANPHAEGLPACGGEVGVGVAVVDEPVMGGTYAKLELTITCSRCRFPWWEGRTVLEENPAAELAAAYVMVAGAAQRRAAAQ